MKGGLPFPCGQCMPCRIARRRVWVHRIMLENRLHGDSSFVTLTYNKDTEPAGGTLERNAPPDWLKRLRRKFTTNPIRYFYVGEYGERFERPHYHAILFGFPTCTGARCNRYPCPSCKIIRDTWDQGHIYLGDVTKDSASYVASYVCKGWTQDNDFTKPLLRGRIPEFSQPSLKPGLGAGAARLLGQSLMDGPKFAKKFFDAEGDVPNVVETDQRIQPLGRYLKNQIRAEIGLAPGCPEEKLNVWKKEMYKLFEDGRYNAQTAEEYRKASHDKKVLLDLNRDAIINIEARFNKFHLHGAL